MKQVHIEIKGLTMAYDDFIIQQDLNFNIYSYGTLLQHNIYYDSSNILGTGICSY